MLRWAWSSMKISTINYGINISLKLMKPFQQFQQNCRSKIRFVLTYIDDTLTSSGKLPAIVFASMERLQQNSIRVIPITCRPAGLCDHIARMWPVEGVIGENGAFYFRYDEDEKKMRRRYFMPEKQRLESRQIGRAHV